MNDTKSLIIFIGLSVILVIWICLLPKPTPALESVTLITPAAARYLANGTPDRVLAPLVRIPFGWTVTVKEYK